MWTRSSRRQFLGGVGALIATGAHADGILNPSANFVGQNDGISLMGGDSGSGPPPNLANVFNWNPTVNLANFRAKRSLVRNGLARGKIICIGDSVTWGFGAGVGTAYTGAHDLAYPYRLAAAMSAGGVPATNESQIAGFAIGVNTVAIQELYNPRYVSTGAGWVVGAQTTAGGNTRLNNSTTADLLSLVPTVPVDTFVPVHYTNTNLGDFSWNIDGGADTTISENAAQGMGFPVLPSVALGSHTLNLKRVSGTVYIAGAYAYNSAVKAFDIINLGQSGSSTINWISVAAQYAPLNAIGRWLPDLTILKLGINDWQGADDVATYTVNMQTIITKAKSVGDLIMVTPNPTGSTANQATQRQYCDAVLALGVTNNVVVWDQHAALVDYATQNALGNMFDLLHPKAVLFNDEGNFLSQLLVGA